MLKKTLLSATAIIVVALPFAASAKEAGDWLVRARAIYVTPDESADISIGGKPAIDNSVMPELDFSYFFTDNIAVELILAVTPHDVGAVGTDIGDVDAGDVTLLPPTLTLQYHFMPKEKMSPYIGVGVNYTKFFDADVPSGGVITDIDYDSSFGLALQAGIDYAINDRWLINVDVKKIWINTDVSINAGAVTADVDIDPWIFGFGVGYRF